MPLTIEQQRAIAIAEAKRRQAEAMAAVASQQPAVQQNNRQGYRPIVPAGNLAAGGQTPATEQEAMQTYATLARYGVPIGVSIPTGGLLPAAMSTGARVGAYSGIGGLSTLVGEGAAQKLEVMSKNRDKMDYRKLGAETLRGSAPITKFGNIWGTIAANMASAAGVESAASYLQDGKVDLGGAAIAGSLVGGMTGLGSKIQTDVNSSGTLAALAKRRGIPGLALLSEINPKFSRIESVMAQKGNNTITEVVDNLDVGIAEAIKRDYPEVQGMPELIQRIFKMTKQLDPLRKAALGARKAAQDADLALQTARANAAEAAPEIVFKAEQAALEATKMKDAYGDAIRMAFGDTLPALDSVAQGQRMRAVSSMIAQADDYSKAKINQLYQDAGVGQNQIVATRKDLGGFLTAQAKPQGVLEGKIIRERVKGVIDKAFNQGDGMTLESFTNLRNDIARDLVEAGQPATNANRIASGVYASITKGADKYMKRTMPNQFKGFKAASKAAAENFKVRGADVIESLRAGDSESVLSAVMAEGKGSPAMAAIEDYARFLGKPTYNTTASKIAAEASQKAFMKDFFGVVRDGVIDSSLNRKAGTVFPLDPKKLAGTLSELESRGFPVEALGLGSRKQIQALARITTGKNEAGFSVDEFSKYAEDSAVLGANVAARRLEYVRELRKNAIRAGLGTMRRDTKRLKALQRAAKVTDDEVTLALQKAENDPLVVFLNDKSMKLSRDPSQNRDWIKKLMTVDTETSAAFMRHLMNTGREADAGIIRKAAATDVMRGLLQNDPTGKLRLRGKAARDLFVDTANNPQAKALRAILGGDEFRLLQRAFGDDIRSISKVVATVDERTSNMVTDLAGQSRVAMSPAGPGIPARVFSSIGGIRDMISTIGYTATYWLMVNPKISPSFRKAGGTVEKWLQAQPANATALRLWMQADEQNPDRN